MWKLGLILLIVTAGARAQWTLQESHTTASLRGIYAVSKDVAWASGTEGTVLRTVDGGMTWTKCAVPPGAEKLDFRGVQAFDKDTAIVMSSGKGDLSRLYKTVDGCATWKLVFTNPDAEGFWDAVSVNQDADVMILGDPVNNHFRVFYTAEAPDKWTTVSVDPKSPGEGAFAASNSSFIDLGDDGVTFLGSGGSDGARLYRGCDPYTKTTPFWTAIPMPMFAKGDGAGIFSLGARNYRKQIRMVAVGGNYLKPKQTEGTAAFSRDYGAHWSAPTSLPGGYRSAVEFDPKTRSWMTVGPNGTDVSTDDGKNWRALKPAPDDAPDADKNWNALSLPFVVGPKGRIGVLRPGALR
jgi:photosystem II stability/assembly factor-like uncharacterized protein